MGQITDCGLCQEQLGDKSYRCCNKDCKERICLPCHKREENFKPESKFLRYIPLLSTVFYVLFFVFIKGWKYLFQKRSEAFCSNCEMVIKAYGEVLDQQML